jgi:hypothetical protein
MIKFMAWERSFEKQAMKYVQPPFDNTTRSSSRRVRAKELKFQRINYLIEVRAYF